MTTQALVIGAGGLTGIAWEAGVLQGLADTGIPVTGWDLVIGSSAGAYVGARLLAEGSTGPIYRAQLEAEAEAETQALATVTGRLPIWLIRAARPPRLSFLARAGVAPRALRAVAAQAARHGPRELGTLRVILRSRRPSGSAADSAEALTRLARANSAPEDVWIGYWRRALGPVTEWPSAPLVMTAVAIDDGSRAVIQHSDGVPLAQALAASTAVPGLMPPITVNGRRHVDGGTRSQTNADLAAGCKRVLVLAPTDRGTLEAELGQLRAVESEVAVIRPSGQASAVMGDELARLDPARVPASARAGREDGRAAAPLVGF